MMSGAYGDLPGRLREDRSVAKMDCALTHVAGGRPVKLVSECLGVARSQLTVRIKHSVSPNNRRSRPMNDADVDAVLQQLVSERPTDG